MKTGFWRAERTVIFSDILRFFMDKPNEVMYYQ